MTDAVVAAKKARTPGERLVFQLEVTNLVLVVLAIVITHLAAGLGPMMYGVAVGGLVGVLNLRSMVWLGRRILLGKQRGRAIFAVLFALKLGVLCAVVWLTLANLPIESLGFLIGFSTLLPSALIATALKTQDPSASGQEHRS